MKKTINGEVVELHDSIRSGGGLKITKLYTTPSMTIYSGNQISIPEIKNYSMLQIYACQGDLAEYFNGFINKIRPGYSISGMWSGNIGQLHGQCDFNNGILTCTFTHGFKTFDLTVGSCRLEVYGVEIELK